MASNGRSYNRFAVALEIQDACNLKAVALELVKVATGLPDPRNDAAVILVINKLDSLVNGSGEHFAEAYGFCKEWAAKPPA